MIVIVSIRAKCIKCPTGIYLNLRTITLFCHNLQPLQQGWVSGRIYLSARLISKNAAISWMFNPCLPIFSYFFLRSECKLSSPRGQVERSPWARVRDLRYPTRRWASGWRELDTSLRWPCLQPDKGYPSSDYQVFFYAKPSVGYASRAFNRLLLRLQHSLTGLLRFLLQICSLKLSF